MPLKLVVKEKKKVKRKVDISFENIVRKGKEVNIRVNVLVVGKEEKKKSRRKGKKNIRHEKARLRRKEGK